MKTFTIVVDLGKRRDRGAFYVKKAKLADVGGKLLRVWVVVYLDLFYGVSYHQIVDSLVNLMGHREIAGDADLLVDAQNVGEAVIEMMRLRSLQPTPILTTGGHTVRVAQPAGSEIAVGDKFEPLQSVGEIHIPKVDLVTAGRKLAQQRRVTVARGVRWREEFKRQMENFRGIQTTRGNVKYEAEDDLVHDDFVWCYLAGAWWVTRDGADEESDAGGELVGAGVSELPDWDPLEHM